MRHLHVQTHPPTQTPPAGTGSPGSTGAGSAGAGSAGAGTALAGAGSPGACPPPAWAASAPSSGPCPPPASGTARSREGSNAQKYYTSNTDSDVKSFRHDSTDSTFTEPNQRKHQLSINDYRCRRDWTGSTFQRANTVPPLTDGATNGLAVFSNEQTPHLRACYVHAYTHMVPRRRGQTCSLMP